MPQIPISIPSCDLDTDVDVNISSPVVPKWKMLKIRHKKKRRNTLARYSWPEFYFFFGGLVFAWYEFGLGRGRGCGCGLLGCCWAYRSTWPSTWIALECCKYFLRLPARRLETETNLECPPWRQMSSEKLSGDEPSLLWGQRRAFEVLIAACQQVTSHRYLLTMLPRRNPKHFWVGLRFYEKQQISKTHLTETSAVIVLYKISLVENIVFVSKNIAHQLNLVSESYPWKMSFTFWFYFLPFCCSCCLFWHCCNSFAFFGNLGYIGCCLKNYLALIFTLNWHFLWNSSVLKSATAAVAVQTNKHSCSSRLLGCPVSKFPRIIGWKSVSPVFWQWHWHSKSKEKNQFNEQNMQ